MSIRNFTVIGLAVGLVVTIGLGPASAEEIPAHGSLPSAGPCDAQPAMQSALRSLDVAWDALNGALPDKGGHRAAAMGLIKATIGEVQAGCAAGGG